MSKRIGRSDIIGEQGIAYIHRIVLDMGYVFYVTGGVEAGVDGDFENQACATYVTYRSDLLVSGAHRGLCPSFDPHHVKLADQVAAPGAP